MGEFDVPLGTPEKCIEALREDGFSAVRKAAAKALGGMKNPRVVRPLIAALREEDPGVRKAAAEALGKIRHPRAVDPLTKALRDGCDDVKEAAANALRKIREDPLTGWRGQLGKLLLVTVPRSAVVLIRHGIRGMPQAAMRLQNGRG